MSEQQAPVDAICHEIYRIGDLHHASQDKQGDAAFWARLQWDGEIIGLRKALCALLGWPMREARKEGRADQYVEQWASERPDGEHT
jgi:hypothetical protein